MRKAAAFATLVCVAIGAVACAPARPGAGTLDRWVGVATQESVKEELGAPSQALPLIDGTAEWTYRFESEAVFEDGTGPSNWSCWEYVLTFGDDEVLRDWTRQRCGELGDPLERARERATGEPGRGP